MGCTMMNSGRIKELLQNENARVLAGNFLALSVLKAVGYLFSFVTLPYLTAVVGVEKFGELGFASAIMVFLETITDWGFNYTATRDVAQNRERPGVVSRIFSEVLFSKALLMVLCFAGLYLATLWIPALRDYRVLLLLTFAYIPGHILFPEWFFQAMEQMKYITILNVLSKTLFTVLVFVVIRRQSDYIYHPLLVACGYFVSGIAALWVILKKFRIRILVPDLRAMYGRLRYSTDMFVCLFFPNLYSNFTTVYLETCCGKTATGLYSGGKRFLDLVDQLTQVLSRIFFPFLARHKEKHSVYVKISGAISVVAALALFFGAEMLCSLFYAPDFAPAATVIRIFSIAPVFLFLMNTYGTNYLVIVGKERILKNIIIGCSLAGFVLTLFLTRRWGYRGAACTVMTVWGIRGLLTYFIAIKVKKQNG